MVVLAYQLLAHLQFTTLLELNHVNPICSSLAQGQSPVTLTVQQQNDALRIYCDEGGHALFVELLSIQVEEAFGIDRSALGCPQFDRTLGKLIDEHQTRLSPNLIKLFIVTMSKTLITKVLHNIPHDPQVASVVRALIGDHAADEALHSVYFRNLLSLLWNFLSPYKQEEIGKLLPQLVLAFLGPDHQVDYSVLIKLGFNTEDAQKLLEKVYVPGQVSKVVRQAAIPTIKIFDSAGVFFLTAVEQVFRDYELI